MLYPKMSYRYESIPSHIPMVAMPVGEEALAAAPIVDYFIYGRLDDEVNRGISPCPRLLVGKQTQQTLGVLRFYYGYMYISMY